MWSDWWLILLAMVGGLALTWLVLAGILWRGKPDERGVRAALALLPDLLRLIRRLAADPEAPRAVRVKLVLLLGYLASPVDLIPDFIPVIGYADDAVIVALVLRSVMRSAGVDCVTRHWSGTADGLAALKRLCGLTDE